MYNWTICYPLLSFPGYYGKGCTDACHLNPCENEAQCHRKPSSSHGYICDCGDNHYGQYCQHRYTPTDADTHIFRWANQSLGHDVAPWFPVCLTWHTRAVVPSLLFLVLYTCVELTTSVPGVGGGLRHVDHVTVTQIRALTPTVTRQADTVTAR